ncbi:MAG: hypothetical protein F9K30_23595 [Dechloromonas sp.]|nr:MAG: hypothetical protein F9K30_23595 [Dechloromonas sp.]
MIRDKSNLQKWTVAALEHMAKHGDFMVLEPIWRGTRELRPTLARRWREYVVAHSFLDYNPNDLVGRKLAAASFRALWIKNKSKTMALEAARRTRWFEFRGSKEPTIVTVDVELYARRVVARLKSLIDGGQLWKDGKRVGAAVARNTFDQELKTLDSAERSRQISDERLKHAPPKIASAPGMARRGSPTVSGGLPSLGKRR